jgi:hypothetical protein
MFKTAMPLRDSEIKAFPVTCHENSGPCCPAFGVEAIKNQGYQVFQRSFMAVSSIFGMTKLSDFGIFIDNSVHGKDTADLYV